MYDDQFADDLSDSLEDSSSVATLEEQQQIGCKPEWTGPRCEKCNEPIKSDVVTICRRCGWYVSLGTFVEVDPNWETENDGVEAAAQPEAKSHLRVWFDLVPRWSWVIIVSVLAVVVESIIVRFATPTDGWLRTAWSLGQLTTGVMLVAGCHVFNFLVLAADDAEFGVLDMLLRPLKLWLRAVQLMPERRWVANLAACGLTAVVMSVVVIGGIPYERLWDWGFQEPVKQELMGAVMDRAKELESRNADLEEAVGDFAGKADVEPDESKAEPEKPRDKADCVILGYDVDREGRLDTLLLGTSHRGELIYAGRVKPEMSDEELATLLKLLVATKTRRSFIPIEAEGTWVEPKFTCRITYGEKQKGGRLRDLRWDRLLGGMNMP